MNCWPIIILDLCPRKLGMNLPFVLDVLISIVFIYLILSLLASEIQELITTLLQWRAKHLKDSIENLISGGTQKIEQRKLNLLINEIYNDPLIRNVNQEAKGVLATGFRSITRLIFPGNRKGAFGRNQSSGPSYIEPETFATVVMERMGVSHLSEKLIEMRLENFVTRILGDVHVAGDRIEPTANVETCGIWGRGVSLELDLGSDPNFYHLVEAFEEIQSDYRSDLITVPLCIDRMAESLDRYVNTCPTDADDRMRTFLERVAADKTSLFGTDNQRAWITGGLQPTLTDIATIVDKSSTTYKSINARYDKIKTQGQELQKRVLDRKSIYLAQRSTLTSDTLNQTSEENEQNCLGSALNELTPDEYRIYQDYQSYQRIDRALDYLPKSFKDSLSILARRAQSRGHNVSNSISDFRSEVATWFDRSMSRTSGVYKRNAKGVALIIGLAIAIFTNSDTFHIFSRVASDDNLRRVITERASQTVQNDGPQNSNVSQSLRNLKDQTQEVLADIPLPITWNPRNLSQQLDCPYNSNAPELITGKPYTLLTHEQWNELYKSCMSTTSVPDIALPLQVLQMITVKPLGFLGMFSGWWISGVAIAMGAPFWFDLLNKIVNFRNTGSKPKDQK